MYKMVFSVQKEDIFEKIGYLPNLNSPLVRPRIEWASVRVEKWIVDGDKRFWMKEESFEEIMILDTQKPRYERKL